MTFFRVYNYSTAFLLLSYSITPKPEKQISGHFETLTAMYWDVPPCELSCKAALQPEKQHSSLPKPWRDAAAGQHCVPSNVTWPEVCLRLCKKGFSWNTTLYSAVKWGSIQVFSLKSAVMFCKIWVATKKMETVFGDSPWKKGITWKRWRIMDMSSSWEKFWLDTREKNFIIRQISQWSNFPRKVMDSPVLTLKKEDAGTHCLEHAFAKKGWAKWFLPHYILQNLDSWLFIQKSKNLFKHLDLL